MAIGQDMPSPFENAPAIEQAVQWIIEDILTNRDPSPENLAIIPGGITTEIIQALQEAQTKGEVKTRQVFNSLCTMHSWLKELRTKPLPPRQGEPGKERKQYQYPLQSLSYFKNKPKREWGVDQIIFD